MQSSWNKILIYSIFGLLSIQFGKTQVITSSNHDTIELNDVITSVLQNNPIIKQSSEYIISSDLAVKLAQTAYLPTIDLNASYSRMDPIPAFDIPQFGHIQMYPDNSVNIYLEARQLIYDFGKTGKSVAMQEINKESTGLSAEQLKQKLVLTSAGFFYSLYYLQTAKSIITEHLNTLKKHLQFIENKQQTGSATQYEILSTRAKVSATEIQLSEMLTAYDVQLSHLNTFMGLELKNITLFADTSNINTIDYEIVDTLFDFAKSHRYDLLILEKKQATANMNYRLIQSQNNPTLAFFGTGGWKNGYISDIEKLKPNYVVGLTLKVPIFEGTRKNIKLNMAGSAINQIKYEVDNSTRQVQDEISESYAQLQLSAKKVDQSKMQLQLAQEAFNHAEINFKEGVITNLDLIYAADMLSDSELQLLKNKIDLQFNILKNKAVLGEMIY